MNATLQTIKTALILLEPQTVYFYEGCDEDDNDGGMHLVY